jgi:hypothetical protein
MMETIYRIESDDPQKDEAIDEVIEYCKLRKSSIMKHTLLDKDVFEYFVKPGEVTEIRILGVFGNSPAWSGFSKGTVAGWFDDHDAFCAAVEAINKVKHGGVYFTPQIIDPRLIARACNRLVVAKETTSDRDVIAYRFLLIDADPVRPAGISSSDAELAAALKLRDEIAGEIASDFHLPEPIRAISGNGGHLLYPLPDPPAAKYGPIIKKMLEAISVKFSTDLVTIDSKVFNPARIWKLYGTIARKGDEVPAGPHRAARPHRLAYIDRLPMQGVPE